MRSVLREAGGDERVDHRLGQAVTHREQNLAPLEAGVSSALATLLVGGSRGQAESRAGEVAQERGDHQLAVTDHVGQKRAKENDDAEPDEPETGHFTDLRLSESVFAGPVAQDASAHSESDTGGQNGHETGP